MPRIDSITPVQYDSLWPYNSTYDNLPLKYILAREELINLAVDNNTAVLEDAIGTAGTLANRLNQSLEPSGALITEAVDSCLHSIGAHTDGTFDGFDYVRMLATERSKLSLVADEATSLQIEFDTISGTVVFDNDLVKFEDSPTVTWNVATGNLVTANFAFPAGAAHQHYYDLIPVSANIVTPDYINYKSTSLSTPFVDGSLRVYLNGIRLSENDGVYVYDAVTGPSGTWYVTSFTSDAGAGTFALSRAINSADTITIDFDQLLV
jgi:membrane-bound inhibitor of C-type lysozyme